MGIISIPILRMRQLKHKRWSSLPITQLVVGTAEVLTQVVWCLGLFFSTMHFCLFLKDSDTLSHKWLILRVSFTLWHRGKETWANEKTGFQPWLNHPVYAAL